MRQIIFFLCLLLNFDLAAKQLAGTDAREEAEYKIPINSKVQVEELTQKIKEGLFSLQQSKEFKIPSKFNENYYLTGKETPFVFLDIYFDTDNFLLQKNKTVYRLRYRWKELSHFQNFLHSKDKKNYPIRAEIQSKDHLQIDDDFFSVGYETRFEFRDESFPFSKKNPAPQAPWPLKEYIEITQNGVFQQYELAPYKRIKKILDNEKIAPKIVIKTERRRFHYNIYNDWGLAPNPYQAFIITLDHYKFKKYEGVISTFQDDFENGYSELEIEFERNISTNVKKEDRELFLQDQKLIKERLVDILKKSHALSNESSGGKFFKAYRELSQK